MMSWRDQEKMRLTSSSSGAAGELPPLDDALPFHMMCLQLPRARFLAMDVHARRGCCGSK